MKNCACKQACGECRELAGLPAVDPRKAATVTGGDPAGEVPLIALGQGDYRREWVPCSGCGRVFETVEGVKQCGECDRVCSGRPVTV